MNNYDATKIQLEMMALQVRMMLLVKAVRK